MAGAAAHLPLPRPVSLWHVLIVMTVWTETSVEVLQSPPGIWGARGAQAREKRLHAFIDEEHNGGMQNPACKLDWGWCACIAHRIMLLLVKRVFRLLLLHTRAWYRSLLLLVHNQAGSAAACLLRLYFGVCLSSGVAFVTDSA